MKLKTSELTGAALDWAVAKCDEISTTFYGRGLWYGPEPHDYRWEWGPSTNWAQGGPIVERELIELTTRGESLDMWVAKSPDWHAPAFGPTPLIAAMRCFVASRLGDEVNIPEELKGESE